jgi:hypothetical protein
MVKKRSAYRILVRKPEGKKYQDVGGWAILKCISER